MTTETLALADFLLARIDEDESVARQAEVDLGRFDRENVANGGAYTGTQGAITLLAMRDGNAMDPARVLAECAAKRRVVAWSTATSANLSDDPFDWDDGEAAAAEHAIALLATAYADHQDYRQEWRA